MVDGDRAGWGCHREGRLQASARRSMPRSVTPDRLQRAQRTVVSRGRRECQREAAGVSHGSSKDGDAMPFDIAASRTNNGRY